MTILLSLTKDRLGVSLVKQNKTYHKIIQTPCQEHQNIIKQEFSFFFYTND